MLRHLTNEIIELTEVFAESGYILELRKLYAADLSNIRYQIEKYQA